MTSTATPSDIIRVVEQVIGTAPRPANLHEPCFTGREKDYVASCIADGWVSSVGAFVDRFERDLATASGAAHAVVVVNGTCALQVALTVCGVGPDEEVLIPSLTFVATANAVVHAGAVPHFVDVEEKTLGVDPVALRKYLETIATVKNGQTVNQKTGRVLRALMPVHVFGHPCQAAALKAIADEYHLLFIEDATEALGSLSHGRKIGSEHLAVFSFNGNKIITTGGGGAIVTQDESLYRRIKHLTTTAKQPHPWEFNHDEVAWNYRMPNINAALGCAQLESLPRFVAAKRALAARYNQSFASLPGVRILMEPENTQSNYWLVTLLAEQADPAWLQEVLTELHRQKIHCRPVWTPLHLLPMYQTAPRASLSMTENLAARILNLPSSVKYGLPYV